MVGLYIILGIVLLFAVLFSFHLTLIIDYAEKTVVKAQYLFLKFTVFDSSKTEKKKKKEKKKEKNSAKENQQSPQNNETGNKNKKGNSLLKQIYLDHGYDGIVKMINAVGKSLNGFFGKLYKTIIIDELYITMITAGNDAADTAIKYGKLCSWAYPILGKLVSTCKVKKYDFNFSPDFLAQKNEASAYIRLHVTPIHITNAAVVLAVQLVFKVLIKILLSKNKSDKIAKTVAETMSVETTDENTINNTITNKEGASNE